MLLRTSSWVALAALCGVLCMLPRELDAEGHNIPSHLIECYQNEDLYHRENRLPSTMSMVIGLLRQIEESPGFNMDARSFSLSLLHMFRVDGIERDPEVEASDRVIPFGLTGQQYYKHRILLQNLIPRSSFLFPNESISDVEKCFLHFVISDSLDKVERGDERYTCDYARSSQQRRHRRDVDDDDDDDVEDDVPGSAAVADAGSDAEADAEAGAAVGDEDAAEAQPASGEEAGAAPRNATGDDNQSAPKVAASPAAGNPDAEMVPSALGAAVPSEDNRSAPEVAAEAPAANPDAEMVPSTGGNDTDPSQRKGDYMMGADGPGPAGRASRGQMQAPPGSARLEIPHSDCPVENGVVYTRWGSVQLGTVLAGIATGFESQSVRIKDIRAGSRAISGLSDTLEIDNRYAATLAGDLAEVALWRGPKKSISVTVGASGNWNSTQAQRWYFVGELNEMTDAEIRGGLDGLIMAHHVIEWNNKANQQLRLSTILERYYSLRGVFDEDYRACERQNHYKDVAKSETLVAQTRSFAYGLYDVTPSIPTITSEGLSDYATEAVEALDQTVRASAQMETNCETTLRSSEGLSPEGKVNLIYVVDRRWSYDELFPALLSLADIINLHPLGSMITVLNAADHQILFNTSDRFPTFTMNMIENKTVYHESPTGMNLHDLLDNSLRNYFTDQLEKEKENAEAGVHSNVVVLMPYSNYDIPSSELRDIETRVDEYRRLFPDVKFLMFASQEKQSYKILVEDYEKDIIYFEHSSAETIQMWELADRIKTVPRRIANPVCGADWQASNYDPVRIYETIPNEHIAYYRIHPKYLFGIGSETIKVREQNKGTVMVCHSRTNEHPHNSDSDENDDSDCSEVAGSEVEIQLNNPCGSSGSYQHCNPLYISVEVTSSNGDCRENTCKAFDDVAVEFQHSRLTCGAAVLQSPLTFAVAVILMFSKILFSS